MSCQDLSGASAKRMEGLDGERSGLWSEFRRLIEEARPRFVFIENVPRLLRMQFERLLGDLHALGYDCEWDVIAAAAVGAPHLRERLWIVAYDRARYPLEFSPAWHDDPDELIPVGIAGEAEGDGRRWPKAGMMRDGVCFELDQVCPRKTKRCNGGMAWIGDRLFDGMYGSLLPTPAAGSYGHNIGGAEGRKGKVKLSLQEMARYGLWSDTVGTIHVEDGSDFKLDQVKEMIEDGRVRLWPTANARDWKDTGDLRCVAENGLLPRAVQRAAREAIQDANPFLDGVELEHVPPDLAADDEANGHGELDKLWPSPRASWNENRGYGNYGQQGKTHGKTLIGADSADEGTMWPTPSEATAHQGPGRHGRDGGPKIRTSVREGGDVGALNPGWVEWLMNMPVGWTDPSCAEPIQFDFSEEPCPRVLEGVENRRQRLSAIGDSLVALIPAWIVSVMEARGAFGSSRINL